MTRVVTAGRPRPTRNTERLITTSNTTMTSTTTRSIEMHTMHEALARERMRAAQHEARHTRIAKELAVSRRWHRVERLADAAGRHAHTAQRRHAVRAR